MNLMYPSESESKKENKVEFITMYEKIFRGDDITITNFNFWNELSLTEPVVSYIENKIKQLNKESLIQCKKNINLLVSHCIDALCDENVYRIVYSVQTLSILLFSLYKRANHNENEAIDFLDMTFGYENIEEKMNTFLQNTNIFLTGEYPSNLKNICVNLFIIIATGLDNINQNVLLYYIMSSNIFELLIELLRDTNSRTQHGFQIVVILTLLVNYRKHESVNPFIVKLSILDDELALNGYGQIISSFLSTFCKQFTQLKSDMQSSWLNSFTGIVGNRLINDEEIKSQQIRENNALLLALYEATHLNRNFVTTLAYTQSETTSSSVLNNTLTTKKLIMGFQINDITTQPFNLLAIFFQYCSIVIQDTQTETISYNVKLCFLILNCISEDQYANSLMHDDNLAFRVQLYKMPMQRKFNNSIASSQPLAATLLDLIVKFITSNMIKKFPIDLYHQCIGILLRILCYQKRCRVRLNYQWTKLWTVLINLLKFLSSNESFLIKQINIFSLASEVVNILNIFITYGDMFLLSPNTYDEFFYEIIRMKSIFIDLNALALRYSHNEIYEHKESAMKLTSSLINLRDICNHFPLKISEWLTKENISTPTESQIMAIIIQNYDTLTLKLEDNLDQFERYSESQKHFEFFSSLVKNIIKTARKSINLCSKDAESILQNYTSSSCK
ncbi:PREDICTED: UPF0668 protein C10orf76 homolog [Ceratosolen solmsi marchali]|uniref:UPF0668 protein C10orf76 homolog n=1 Tax=Ceratosolen solmsi marchali TaxID=326594 RepID=A0AAJ6YDF9_9HYME|nr:PREDICTED: UPF0668 protein C10orf76 homolog [Ceratosolen solmsi marchali]